MSTEMFYMGISLCSARINKLRESSPLLLPPPPSFRLFSGSSFYNKRHIFIDFFSFSVLSFTCINIHKRWHFLMKKKMLCTRLSTTFFSICKKCHRLCIFIYLFHFNFFFSSFVMLFMQTHTFPSVYTRRKEWSACDYFASVFRSLHIPHTFQWSTFSMSSLLSHATRELSPAQFSVLHLHHHDLSVNSHLYFLLHIHSHRKLLMDVWHCVSSILLLTCSPLYPVLIVECHSNDSKIPMHIHRGDIDSDRHKHAQWGRKMWTKATVASLVQTCFSLPLYLPPPLPFVLLVGGPVLCSPHLTQHHHTGINDTRFHTHTHIYVWLACVDSLAWMSLYVIHITQMNDWEQEPELLERR